MALLFLLFLFERSLVRAASSWSVGDVALLARCCAMIDCGGLDALDDSSGAWKLWRAAAAVVGVMNVAWFVSMPLEAVKRDESAAIPRCCPPFVSQMTVNRPHFSVVNPLRL